MTNVALIRSAPSVPLHSSCPRCGFLKWCLPANLELSEAERLNDRVTHQRPIKRGSYLHHAGEALGSLHVVCSGFIKTILNHDSGNLQVTGFSMPGELIGIDAISTGKHLSDTVALEDSTLCGMPYAVFENLSHAVPALQHHFNRIMSAEITRDHELMFLLGSMNAKERIAVFLLRKSKRFAAHGYSATHFRLPMTRQDIASYIGLTLETVSRALSDLQHDEIIAINGKDVEIRNLAGLQKVLH